jgi:lysophospholipase L1-like esterase
VLPLAPDPASSLPASDVPAAVLDPASQQVPLFKKILCFGDSLTAGVTLLGLPAGSARAVLTPVEGYVPKLAFLLQREFGEGIELINSGVPSEALERGIRRLQTETLIYQPDLVLLLQGVVDINVAAPPFIRARVTLREMVRIGKGRGATVILGTVPPLNPAGFRVRDPNHVVEFNRLIRQVAEVEEVVLADHEAAFNGELSLQGPDGLHPNDDGYRVMAETWMAAILRAAVPAQAEQVNLSAFASR